MAKILIFSYYRPAFKAGGPINSVESICNIIQSTSTVYIVSPSKDIGGDLIDYHGYWKNRENAINIEIKDSPSVFWLNEFVTKNGIDIIYLNSFFDYKILISVVFVKIFKKYKVILAPRGQLDYGAVKSKNRWIKCFYIFLFSLFFKRWIDTFHSTCVDESKRITKLLSVKENQLTEIENLRFLEIGRKYFDRSNKIDGNLNLVFFSRIVPKKNLLNGIKMLNNSGLKGIGLSIYGTIEDSIYWDECLKQMKQSPGTITCVYKGVIKPELVLEELSQYDAFFFPTLGENFGHVIVEALYSGLPLIIGSNTPFSEDILNHDLGIIIDVDNWSSFNSQIDRFNALSHSDMLIYKKRILKYILYRESSVDSVKKKYFKLLS